MAYYFYLGKTLLPVSPEKLKLKVNNANQTYTMVNTGEINIRKVPGLTEIEFDALLPNSKYPFAVYKNGTFRQALYYLEKLEKFKTKKKKFQFIVSRKLPDGTVLFNTNLTCTLEEYTVQEDKKSYGTDVSVSVKLKQYREYGTKTCKVKTKKNKKKVSKSKTRASTKNTSKTKTYTVKKGDCLWNIAKKFYGDGSQYMKIYNANKKLLGNRSPNLIYPGEKLTIPPLD